MPSNWRCRAHSSSFPAIGSGRRSRWVARKSRLDQQIQQLIVVDRFDEVVIETGFMGPEAVGRLAVAGDGDEDRLLAELLLANFRGHLVAVLARKADVQDDVTGLVLARLGDGRRAVMGGADVVAQEREQLGERPGGVLIVVDDQDPDRRVRPG